jgi:hypothetical protein
MHEDSELAKISSDLRVVTCDAQKIFSPLRLEIKECYFPSRINNLNQIFCEIGENSQSFCFLSNDKIKKNSREHINFILKLSIGSKTPSLSLVSLGSKRCEPEPGSKT